MHEAMNVDAVKILEGMEDDLSREAIGLFTSPRNQRITHINNNFEVIDPESNRLTILKGVTTSLKSYVWPHYNYTELAENVKYLPEELRGEKPPDGVSELDGVGINSGSRRGSRVHGEVEMFVHGHHESVDFKNTEYHPLTLDVINHIINPSSRRAVVMDRSTVDHGLGFDAWIILAAEFKLFDVDTGIASAVDIVCINADGVLCFIELKVGHAQTWHSSCGTMIGTGSSNVALSPLNQALVQVGMYGVMASCKYNIRNLRMVVLNVNYSGVREYCVTPDFLTRVVTPIYLHVKESIRIEKQQRIADREARKAERKRLREQYGSAIAKKIIKGQSSVSRNVDRGSHLRITRDKPVPLHEKLRYPATTGTRQLTGAHM